MILKYYPNASPDPKLLDKLSKALEDGELIILPTDTVYSICCDALNSKAIEKLAHLKGVDASTTRFAILCSDLSQAATYAKISNEAFRLIKSNTPGPFTFILPTSSALPRIYRGRKEVGIRIPDHPLVHALCSYRGTPITGSSLPKHDEEDIAFGYNPDLIHELWGDRVRYVVDGGDGLTTESAIVSCVAAPYEVIRAGAKALKT